VRSRSVTGKPCRMLRNDWTEAWERPDAPKPLGMPLQGMVTMDMVRRTNRYAKSPQAQQVAFNPVGQVVGQMNEVRSVREVIFDLVEQYVDAADRLKRLGADA
jgi:NAD(P)H-dependent flavin oxidoreductase YrpB (nitropropane dioxygenase family)